MSKICQITGKKAQLGNNVSHSKHRTKRSFDVTLFSKKTLTCSARNSTMWRSSAGSALRLAPQVCVSLIK